MVARSYEKIKFQAKKPSLQEVVREERHQMFDTKRENRFRESYPTALYERSYGQNSGHPSEVLAGDT